MQRGVTSKNSKNIFMVCVWRIQSCSGKEHLKQNNKKL